MGHIVSFATTIFYYFSMKAAIGNFKMSEYGCVPIKLYPQTQAVGWFWPVGDSFPTLSLDYRLILLS